MISNGARHRIVHGVTAGAEFSTMVSGCNASSLTVVTARFETIVFVKFMVSSWDVCLPPRPLSLWSTEPFVLPLKKKLSVRTMATTENVTLTVLDRVAFSRFTKKALAKPQVAAIRPETIVGRYSSRTNGPIGRLATRWHPVLVSVCSTLRIRIMDGYFICVVLSVVAYDCYAGCLWT